MDQGDKEGVFLKTLACLKRAREAGGITEEEHESARRAATAAFMGVGAESLFPSPPAVMSAVAGGMFSTKSSGTGGSKRSRSQRRSVEIDDESDFDSNEANDEGEPGKQVQTVEPAVHQGKKRAARKARVQELLDTSAVASTMIYVLVNKESKITVEERHIPNQFVDKDGGKMNV